MWLNVWPGANKSDADLNFFLLMYIGRWGNAVNEASVKVIITDSPYNLTSLGIRGAWRGIIMAVLLETSCVERGFVETWALPQAVPSERMEEADVRVRQLDLLFWLGQVY